MAKFDITVIGGGPGGYPAAIRARQLGASVALVEQDKLGGTCLNRGCIPTKTIIASSDLLARMKHCGDMGLAANTVEYDYKLISSRKDDVVSKLRSGVTQLLKSNGVKVLNGTGSFVGRNRISVNGTRKHVIDTGSTIIATGSTPAMPGFLPKSKRVVDSTDFLALQALPPSMIVLGGGVIGCEFACMAAQLDVKVTVVELLDDILAMLDPDIRRELKRHMEEDLGITVLTGSPMQDITATRDAVHGKVGKERIEADLLLAALGRRPVTQGLDLEQAGLSLDENGCIEIDDFCRTRAATIYAVGDVTSGSTQLAHAATSQGLTAAENACTGRRKRSETIVPACIFTSPEIGSVGLTETEARERGIPYDTGKFPFAALGKALAAGEPAGFTKWIVDSSSGQLLGAHVIGSHATELISEAAVAVRSELTVTDLYSTVHCHPTLSEAWMEAAHAVAGECIHAAPRKRADAK